MARESKAPVKLSSVVDASRYVNASTAATLTVGVRVRPLVRAEIARGGRRDIVRVLDSRVVLVLDPDDSKDYLDQVQNRTKEKRYTFDIAFGTNATNRDVYNGTVKELVGGVLQGINTTVFAYGATGSGKTYTMVGTPQDPGLMVLCLEKIFNDRDTVHREEDFTVTCSYLEVYNEIIYDLLVRSSSPLELREDPELGVVVAGLRHITVTSAAEIMSLLEEGNRRRKTEATDANASSSRSHAVLEIIVKRTPKNHYKVTQLRGKLSLVDLAGSERAAETNNAGQKLRDGANINRSLLALANCINALGKANGGKAASYVPYRNSKLTRLLKDGLSGNSRTAMVATVSGSSDQYHHSINTLKYADRAKEIKTHVVQNVGTVESHVADYQRIIDNLQTEVQDLRAQLIEREAARPVGLAQVARTSEEDLLVLIGKLVEEMNDNIEERINLQKALFEIEDANLYNKHELGQLDEFLDAGKGHARDVTEARERRAEVLEATRENDRERERYKSEIAANEVARKDIQARVQAIVDSNQSAAFLNLLSTFRLQALHLQELKFQMAVRDQIIGEQRQVIGNLWKIIDKSGLPRERVVAVAKAEGIIMDGLQGGDGGPPTVGSVPLSEALKAVKEEMGIPDMRVTPEVPPGAAKRVSERQLRYRAWPPGAQCSPNANADGRSASADASPYGSSEDGGAASDDDRQSVHSEKSPLRGRGGHHRSAPLLPQASILIPQRSTLSAVGPANGAAPDANPQQQLQHHYSHNPNPHTRRSSIHVHLAREVSGLGEDGATAGAGPARRLDRPGPGGGSVRVPSLSGALPGRPSVAGAGGPGMGGQGGAGGQGTGAAGSATGTTAAGGANSSPSSLAPTGNRRRIPGAPISARRAEPSDSTPSLHASPSAANLTTAISAAAPATSSPSTTSSASPVAASHAVIAANRLEHIKSGRRAGQQKAKPPPSDLGNLAAGPLAEGVISQSGAQLTSPGPSPSSGSGGGGQLSSRGRTTDCDAAVAFARGSTGGMPSAFTTAAAAGILGGDEIRAGRRRHTLVVDPGGGLSVGGGGESAAGLDTSDEGLEGLPHVSPEGPSRSLGTRSESINLVLQGPPPQAPLNERLARLKGRLSSAAAIAALPLPGEVGGPTSPPPVLAGAAAPKR